MALGTLLRNQGLERFEAAFRDNGIYESVLPHLTQDHLRELGLPFGARIKLLAANAGLAKETEKQQPPARVAACCCLATTSARLRIFPKGRSLKGSKPPSNRKRA